MKKITENKNELKNGIMTGNTIKTNSIEYKKVQVEMYNRIKEQSRKDKI